MGLLRWPGHPGDFHELPKWPWFLNRHDSKRPASLIKRGLAKMRRGVMRQLVRPPSPQAPSLAYDWDSVADMSTSVSSTLHYPSQPPSNPEDNTEPEDNARQRYTPETSGQELVPETPPDHWHD